MKWIVKLAMIVALLGLSSGVTATIPTTINYQGYLTDSSGAAVSGTHTITFAIYNANTGGAPLWSATQSVNVSSGLFSTELGMPQNPFPVGLFETPLWVGVAINADPEMTPRRAMTTVGFAFESDNAQSLDGQSAATFDQSAHVTDTGNPHTVTAAQSGAATSADLAALQAQLTSALATIAMLQTDLGAVQTSASDNAGQITALQTDVTAAANGVATNGSDIAGLSGDVVIEANARIAQDLLLDAAISAIASNSVLTLDGVLRFANNANGQDTALFENINVQITNGSGMTDDRPNSRGNLIIGYDTQNLSAPEYCSDGAYTDQITCESGGNVWDYRFKAGSHNLIIGDGNNYSQTSGLAIGSNNGINRAGAIAMGSGHLVSGINAMAAGGSGNTASGDSAAALGGTANTADAQYATTAGGDSNTASGPAATVSGGRDNEANGESASVSGGRFNIANGQYSSISGGGGASPFSGNTAYANYSSVLGGSTNIAGDLNDSSVGEQSTISGGTFNSTTGVGSTVNGGAFNVASGLGSTISGGQGNTAIGITASVGGGFENSAVGNSATVSGGSQNSAVGNRSSVSGGLSRSTLLPEDWRAGSLFEDN